MSCPLRPGPFSLRYQLGFCGGGGDRAPGRLIPRFYLPGRLWLQKGQASPRRGIKPPDKASNGYLAGGLGDFPGGAGGKEPACRCRSHETRARSLGEGTATRFRILAWRIPWTEEPGGLQSVGSQSDMTEVTQDTAPVRARRQMSLIFLVCEWGRRAQSRDETFPCHL